jgi:hypothetical protein
MMSALYIVTNNDNTSDTDRYKARAELAALRARVVELEATVSEAHLVMVKIGNDLNWDAPADEQLADAINSCRYALDAANPAPEEVTK